METITMYIAAHSSGRNRPIPSSSISEAFGISGQVVRRLVNTARTNGDPICSCGRGYYIAKDRDEIQKTIAIITGGKPDSMINRKINRNRWCSCANRQRCDPSCEGKAR